MKQTAKVVNWLTFVSVLGFSNSYEITSSVHDLDLLVGESVNVTFKANGSPEGGGFAYLSALHGGVVELSGDRINLSTKPPWKFLVTGKNLGHDIISLNASSNPKVDASEAFFRITVLLSKNLATFSLVVGWMYFVAWSISFYPQIIENWRRKSVVGLNFDFLALNLVGFILYSLFNCGLYWIPSVEAEYFEKNPRGLNPVQLNDIVFSVHAAIITLFTIFQCFIYERGGQTVSLLARIILGIFFLTIIVSLILPFFKIIGWLMFLNICSYIKLVITLIKYIPQAYMNYKRKSTIGWSIGNVLLDFTGGLLSMLQMLINAENYDDWGSIFGDPTKFGLGLFSVMFDILFLLQHYVLYKHLDRNRVVLSDALKKGRVTNGIICEMEPEKSGSSKPLIF